MNVAGDFFLLGSVDDAIVKPLTGVQFDRDHVRQALADVDMAQIILNFNNEQLINLLFD